MLRMSFRFLHRDAAEVFDQSDGGLVRRGYFAYPLAEEAKSFVLTGIKTIIVIDTITSIKKQ